jgi:multidrug transporter EmrE-like cation transporter
LRIELILLILLSVLLSSGSQVLLKFGMSAPAIQAAIANDGALNAGIAIGSSLPVLMGLTCFGLSAIAWLLVLSKIPLSAAYPFVALGIAITVTAGKFLFDEPVTGTKLLGIALIVAGVMFVSASS